MENIILTVEDHIAVITLNRPTVMNALNKQMVTELDKTMDDIANNSEIKAVIITGEKNFAAGADVSNMIEFNPEQARDFSFKDTFNKVENLRQPVIAAMEGYALGGGLELALACDLRIAAANAKFGLPEINLGIFPGAGGTQRLPRLIGAGRAKQIIYLGKMIDAPTALQYGLINQMVEDDVKSKALNLAQKLAAKAPVALKLAKKAINSGLNTDLKTGIEFEAMTWGTLFATDDQKEGMRAFLDKRKPKFMGN
ncbi:MAG TPA: enoyl-CoA hydratase-related protein [Syntrophomonadaceae bacterium]|nr:enoyl-CoA hydratase-related protein [Syntrophomonadaceae bacterium]